MTTIYKIQAYDLMKYQHFCIGLINFMVKGKILADFKYLLSPSCFKGNIRVLLNHFLKEI